MKGHSIIRRIVVSTTFFIVLGIVAPIIVFYSLGYRFDKEKKSLVYSGSIVLKTTPYSTQLFVDKKEIPQKNVDLINRSYNINSLEPGNYDIEVRAPGFYPWKKKAEVHAGIATEFWNVLLIPELLDKKTIIEENLIKYSFSPDKSKIAYFIEQDNYISVFVRDQSQNENVLVYREPANQQFVPVPGELKWSSDGKWLLFSLRKNNVEEISLTDDNSGFTEIIPLGEIWKKNLTVTDSTKVKNKKESLSKEKPIVYSWDDQGNIYFVFDGTLYSQSIESIANWWKNKFNQDNENANKSPNEQGAIKKNSSVSPEKLVFDESSQPYKIKDKVSGFAFCGDYLCSINIADKKLEVFDQKGGLQASVSFPENYQMTDSYQIFAYSNKLLSVLDEKANLFLWDEVENKEKGNEGIKFIFPEAKQVYFSNDGKKLLFTTSNEAYVYFVKDWEVQPRHTAGDLEVLFRDSQELEKAQWYWDYQNIFIKNKEGIKMIELDSRGGRNSGDFLKANNLSDFSYDTVDKKMWFMEEDENNAKKLQEVVFPETRGIFSGIMNIGTTP